MPKKSVWEKQQYVSCWRLYPWQVPVLVFSGLCLILTSSPFTIVTQEHFWYLSQTNFYSSLVFLRIIQNVPVKISTVGTMALAAEFIE